MELLIKVVLFLRIKIVQAEGVALKVDSKSFLGPLSKNYFRI